MDPSSTMEKKAVLRGTQLASKGGTETPVKEYGGKKSVPQHVRKKEWERGGVECGGRRGRGGRPSVRLIRPREKTGSKVEVCEGQPESGSLYSTGGKKRQSITHLLDWWGPGHRGGGGHRSGGRVQRYSSHTPKHTKEHYLQANCQFVVGDDGDYCEYAGNQDKLVEWGLVEEVRLHVSSAPACPICLHPPTAAKVTRCGHIYCFPCILHYLALSDKRWRNCPICYEPVDREDLKSVVAVCHGELSLGEEVELQLMRRERDSLLPVPASVFTPALLAASPCITRPNPASPYAKLLLASKVEVQSEIVGRERRELEYQLSLEGDQPESCFIHQALELLHVRLDSLSSPSEKSAEFEASMEALSLSSPDKPLSSSESFSSFDDPFSPLSPTSEPFTLLDKGGNGPCNGYDDARNTRMAAERGKGMLKREDGTTGSSKANQDVTVEDLDISQLQPDTCSSATPGGQRLTPKSTFYFYQAKNGAHVYLHSLNVQMLVQEYGSLEKCPPVISGRVVEKVTVSMTEELRFRLRYLRHLPLTCSFEMVEVALSPPILSRPTLAFFQEKIDARQRSRNRRAREERKIEKRVRAEEDRMLGRSKGAPHIKIESYKQFPSFCDEYPPSIEDGGVGIDNDGDGPDDGGVGVAISVSESSVVVNDASDLPNATSPPDTSSAMSFAKMIREGQTCTSRASRPSTGSRGSVWPSLGGHRQTQSSQPGYGGRAWEARQGEARGQGECSDGEEDGEEGAAPEFKHAFSTAVARALDAAAARKTMGSMEGEEKSGSGKKGRNKKKKKQVVLFSSGGLN